MTDASKTLAVVATTDDVEELRPNPGAPLRVASHLATTVQFGVWRIESLTADGGDDAIVTLCQPERGDGGSPRATICCKVEHLKALTNGVTDLWDAHFALTLQLAL